MSAQDRDRYRIAVRKLQRIKEEYGDEPTITVHSMSDPVERRAQRVAHEIDAQALAKLLVAKGVITRDELEKALADDAEAEIARIVQALGRQL